MKDLTLLIMAAGMGSRFGGLKQIEPIGPGGEFIIDYSIYDAIRSGFTKVVFVIKKENEELFKETIGNRIAEKIKVEYVFQEQDYLPEGYEQYKDRKKPWGTAHAILCAKEAIHEPFLIINSDDFYGYESYLVASNHLKEMKEKDYFIVGYPVRNTLSENGSVKRGICIQENGILKGLVESKLEEVDGKIIASPLDGKEAFEVSNDALVSMNMIGFEPSIFTILEQNFITFLENNKEDLQTCEYLIPDVLEGEIKKQSSKVTIVKTEAKWLGMTYREDKEYVVKRIEELILAGVYPENLWK